MPPTPRSNDRPSAIAPSGPGACTRRGFLAAAGSCAAHLILAGEAGASALFAPPPGARIVQEVPWGRLEEIAPGVWALVSTPLEDPTTLCNGGIVQGRDGVVMVEAFGSPAGATWMARQARRLTGRWPDRVVVTHYHGDHSAGLPGLESSEDPAVAVLATPTTRALTRGTALGQENEALLQALERVVQIPSTESTTLDLGGRSVRLVPREGHTASDVSVEVDDPAVTFCGDLVWNRFFPNYVDAVPSLLTPAVRALRREPGAIYVPGHGPVADEGDFELHLELLERVEAQARAAHERGADAQEAAADFVLPPALEDWFRFSPAYPERALGAWLREFRTG